MSGTGTSYTRALEDLNQYTDRELGTVMPEDVLQAYEKLRSIANSIEGDTSEPVETVAEELGRDPEEVVGLYIDGFRPPTGMPGSDGESFSVLPGPHRDIGVSEKYEEFVAEGEDGDLSVFWLSEDEGLLYQVHGITDRTKKTLLAAAELPDATQQDFYFGNNEALSGVQGRPPYSDIPQLEKLGTQVKDLETVAETFSVSTTKGHRKIAESLFREAIENFTSQNWMYKGRREKKSAAQALSNVLVNFDPNYRRSFYPGDDVEEALDLQEAGEDLEALARMLDGRNPEK